MNKGTTIALIIVFALSFYIAIYWDDLDVVRESVEAVLDPTFGVLIEWNTLIGFLLIVAILSFVLTMAQKFLTDQNELKKLKVEQKAAQAEIKNHKDNPEKMMELQKKSLESMPQMLKLSMGSFAYTGIPIILFFRWFQAVLDPIFGGWWLLYYIIATMIFSSIFRKFFKVA